MTEKLALNFMFGASFVLTLIWIVGNVYTTISNLTGWKL